jgi:hypothetical protein
MFFVVVVFVVVVVVKLVKSHALSLWQNNQAIGILRLYRKSHYL